MQYPIAIVLQAVQGLVAVQASCFYSTNVNFTNKKLLKTYIKTLIVTFFYECFSVQISKHFSKIAKTLFLASWKHCFCSKIIVLHVCTPLLQASHLRKSNNKKTGPAISPTCPIKSLDCFSSTQTFFIVPNKNFDTEHFWGDSNKQCNFVQTNVNLSSHSRRPSGSGPAPPPSKAITCWHIVTVIMFHRRLLCVCVCWALSITTERLSNKRLMP